MSRSILILSINNILFSLGSPTKILCVAYMSSLKYVLHISSVFYLTSDGAPHAVILSEPFLVTFPFVGLHILLCISLSDSLNIGYTVIKLVVKSALNQVYNKKHGGTFGCLFTFLNPECCNIIFVANKTRNPEIVH
jgi:hypothetical protein